MTFQPSDPTSGFTSPSGWEPHDDATAIGDILRGTTAPAPPPEDEDLPPVTHYAAPTASGAADGSSASDPFLISDFLALPPSPGDHLQLASGTMASPTSYTGSDAQLVVSGVSGTEADRIVVSCETEGGVLFDGEEARDMVEFTNCSFWLIQGFNIRNTRYGGSVFRTGSDNNVARKIIAWDCDADLGGSLFAAGNTVSDACRDNLFEDCAGWGEGQEIFKSSQGGEGTVFRRCFMIGHTWKAIQFSYQSHDNLVENCISTWDALGHTIESEISSRGTLCVGRIDKGIEGAAVDAISNSKMLACISYIPSEADISAGTNSLRQLIDVMREQGGLTFRDIVLYTEQTLGSGQLTQLRNLDETSPASVHEDVTEITGAGNVGGAAGTGWTTSNRVTVETVGSAPSPFQTTAGSGARVYYRTVDGVLTDTLLWPWPMDARIRAAMTLSGRDPDVVFRGAGNGMTEMMENIFGTIPGI